MASIKKLINLVKDSFEEGEEILSYVDGAFQATVRNKSTLRSGILVATNRKVRFCGKRLFFIYDDVIEYCDIYKVEITKEKFGDTIFIDGKKKSYFMKFVISKDVKKFLDTLQHFKGKRL